MEDSDSQVTRRRSSFFSTLLRRQSTSTSDFRKSHVDVDSSKQTTFSAFKSLLSFKKSKAKWNGEGHMDLSGQKEVEKEKSMESEPNVDQNPSQNSILTMEEAVCASNSYIAAIHQLDQGHSLQHDSQILIAPSPDKESESLCHNTDLADNLDLSSLVAMQTGVQSNKSKPEICHDFRNSEQETSLCSDNLSSKATIQTKSTKYQFLTEQSHSDLYMMDTELSRTRRKLMDRRRAASIDVPHILISPVESHENEAGKLSKIREVVKDTDMDNLNLNPNGMTRRRSLSHGSINIMEQETENNNPTTKHNEDGIASPLTFRKIGLQRNTTKDTPDGKDNPRDSASASKFGSKLKKYVRGRSGSLPALFLSKDPQHSSKFNTEAINNKTVQHLRNISAMKEPSSILPLNSRQKPTNQEVVQVRCYIYYYYYINNLGYNL